MSHIVTRRILIQKGPNGLGFSVKGGGDVGFPLTVSRVEAGGGAVGLLKIGMEVSAVNGISLEGLPHYAAVEVLRRTRSPVILFVRNPTPESEIYIENVSTLKRRASQRYSDPYKLSAGTMRPQSSSEQEGARAVTGQYNIDYNTLSYETSSPESSENRSRYHHGTSNVQLYDLRTVKKFVKEILHLPKEVFAKKLAWKYPPVALGKFHKWLLSKLERFDCEAPQNSSNYIFDAFSQSLYLSRSIYDLVHLIRTLIAMERTDKSEGTAVLPPSQPPTHPTSISTAEFNNPQMIATFLSELTEIRAQLTRAKEKGGPMLPGSQESSDVKVHISKQDAEIRALRDQLTNYEARIAALTFNPSSQKEGDLGTFFKEGFKRIKMKTLKRKQSLSRTGSEKVAAKPTEYRPSDHERAKRSASLSGNEVLSRGTAPVSNGLPNQPCTSTPTRGQENTPAFSNAVSDDHNEILVQVGEQVCATTRQAASSDEIRPENRDRIYSSDDDYVQMHSALSPDGTLPKAKSDPLATPPDGEVIRRISRDHKRSSVDSSHSKASTESFKMKHKQTIMIDSAAGALHDNAAGVLHDSSDYMQMSNNESDTETDYVHCDRAVRSSLHSDTTTLQDEVSSIKCSSTSFEKAGEERQSSDTISTTTVKEERQIHAAQVTEMGHDVDSILGDVKLLYMMEEALKKPATLPPNTPYKFAMGSLTNGSFRDPLVTSPGTMIKAHEVPIYAEVERVPRPFSYGETSNCSYTSHDECERHEVCTKQAPHVRKTSLTSNGSSVEQKSDYSSDRPSSYNTSHTTCSTEMSHSDNRFSRVSDLPHDEDQRLSVLSDTVFSPQRLIPEDPLRESTPGARTNNVKFDTPPTEDCLHQVVGEDFFKHRDSRGREKTPKKMPFKKMMSFGKGKNKKKSLPDSAPDGEKQKVSQASNLAAHSRSRSGSCPSRSRSGSCPTSRTSAISYTSHETYSSRSRGDSGQSSYSPESHCSTRSSGHSSFSQEAILSPRAVKPIIESIDNSFLVPDDQPEVDGAEPDGKVVQPGSAEHPNQLSDNSEESTSEKPRGFYDDLGVEINFDEIPVKIEPLIDLKNETIIDLDGDIIKDPNELKILHENNSYIFNNSQHTPCKRPNTSLIVDSNLNAKVAKELTLANECSKMVTEIERLSSPPPASVARLKSPQNRRCTPSPSFSEIDMLLGDISKDLDNFNI